MEGIWSSRVGRMENWDKLKSRKKRDPGPSIDLGRLGLRVLLYIISNGGCAGLSLA